MPFTDERITRLEQQSLVKKILVLFATREGQTEKVALHIGTHLRDAGAEVQLVNAADLTSLANIEPAGYDHLVFGASMHAGGIEKELVDFVNRHQGTIEHAARSFFLVLLSAATSDPQLREKWLLDARKKMDEQLQVSFDEVEMIAGALKYSKYPLPLKWLMRQIARKAGSDTDISRDYEYTDWQQVARYAQKLMSKTSGGSRI